VAGAAGADPGLEERERKWSGHHARVLALTGIEASAVAEEIDADLWDWASAETRTVHMTHRAEERQREALRLSRIRRSWERHGLLALEGLGGWERGLVTRGYRERSADAEEPPEEPSMPLRWVAWRVARGLPVSAEIVAERFAVSLETAAGVMAGGWVTYLGEFEEVER
jgi:hypothetical protein